ncbi:aminotransferase class IV [Brevibacterium sp. FAM 24638]|uniref:aminotransferase class IV n=1 Tax=Brevibacterium sp. FAM 24638 TaxID=3415681 RepID=UPI003C7B7577
MTVWVWNSQESRFEEPSEDVGTWTLLAADSWFVEDSRVRAFERHQVRFAYAAGQVGVGARVTAEFWASVVEKIPKTGEWFPRVDVLEAAPGGSRMLAFRLRPAPPRTRELRVLLPPYSDPRSRPERKGPDIALLERLRKQAREEYDCDEVLLLSEDGYVIEGATTSLLWWDGDTLCAPDPALGPLPGVTSAVILDEARARSIPVEYHRVKPEVLIRHEVWLVNALHGTRQVKDYVDESG